MTLKLPLVIAFPRPYCRFFAFAGLCRIFWLAFCSNYVAKYQTFRGNRRRIYRDTITSAVASAITGLVCIRLLSKLSLCQIYFAARVYTVGSKRVDDLASCTGTSGTIVHSVVSHAGCLGR